MFDDMSGQARLPRPRVLRTPRRSYRWMGELLWNLILHRISIRYKETILGFGWILLQPVALTLIFTYIRRIAAIPTGQTPYPLFVATGLVMWSFTSLVVAQCAGSLAGSGVLLKRIALPKVLFPLAVVFSALADLGVMLILLAGLFLRYPPEAGFGISTCLWVALVFGLHLLLLTGLGFLVAVVNVFFRDLGQAVPHLLWLWFFASPVFYPASMVPKEFVLLARWNPMTGILEGYRSTLLLGIPPPTDLFLSAIVSTALIFAAGMICFLRLESLITDML